MVSNSGFDQRILNAILYFMNKGYEFNQINSYLLNKGFSQQVISQYYNYALSKFKNNQSQNSFQNQAVSNTQATINQSQNSGLTHKNTRLLVQIVEYIRNMENRGYTFQQIKSYLIQRGYPSNLIDDAAAHLQPNQFQNSQQQYANNLNNNQSSISSSNNPNETTITNKHELHVPSKTMFHLMAIFAVIILLGGGMFYFFNLNPNKDVLLDLIIYNEEKLLEPGADLTFDLTILSMGAREMFDITLTYKILDENLNVIDSNQDTVAIHTQTRIAPSIKLPRNIPEGIYTMKVYSDYSGKTAQSSFDFRVENFQVSGINSSVNDTLPNNLTTTIPNNNLPDVILPPAIDDPNSYEVISFREFLDKIFRTSDSSERAIQKCLNIRENRNKETCIEMVSIEYNNSNICAEINSTDIRDDCYLSHLFNKDLTVCDNIINSDSKANCNLVKDLFILSQYDDENMTMEEIIANTDINITIITDSTLEEVEVLTIE